MNTGNARQIFDVGQLKVMRAVPENHLINFFGVMFVLTDSMLLRKKAVNFHISILKSSLVDLILFS